jgi:putative transposase
MKKRYSEEQIITAIKEHEAGAKVDDICRRLGISSGTFYNWRSGSRTKKRPTSSPIWWKS